MDETRVLVGCGVAASAAVSLVEIGVCLKSETLAYFESLVTNGGIFALSTNPLHLRYVAFKAAAEGRTVLGSDILPTVRQLEQLRALASVRRLVATATIVLVGTHACVTYREGQARLEEALLDGTAVVSLHKESPHLLEAQDKKSKSWFGGPSSPVPALLLRLGDAHDVAQMVLASRNAPLSNSSGNNIAPLPLPVLTRGQDTALANAELRWVVQTEKKNRGGSFLAFHAVTECIKTHLSLRSPIQSADSLFGAFPRVILQSGGIGRTFACSEGPEPACTLAAQLRREFPARGRENQVVVLHIGACKGPASLGKAKDGALVWADRGILSVDGRAALLCCSLAWIKGMSSSTPAVATKEKVESASHDSSKAPSTAASGNGVSSSARRASSTISGSSEDATSESKNASSTSAGTEEEPVHMWYAVEQVGGAVRAAAQKSQLGLAWMATTSHKRIQEAWPREGLALVWNTLLLALTWKGQESGHIDRPVIFVDIGNEQEDLKKSSSSRWLPSFLWTLGSNDSKSVSIWHSHTTNEFSKSLKNEPLGLAVVQGLSEIGYVLKSCQRPGDLPASTSPQTTLVLVRRSSDVATLQAARDYGRHGYKTCAITDAMSLEDLTDGASRDGSSITMSLAAENVSSLSASTITPTIFAHCCSLISEGNSLEQIAEEMEAGMLSLMT